MSMWGTIKPAVGLVARRRDVVVGALSALAVVFLPTASWAAGGDAYVANSGGASVSLYDVGAGGLLAAKTPATVTAGSGPNRLAVSPDGRSLYVTNFGGASVSQYHVGAGGLLTAKTPATVAAGMGATGVAVSPDGRSVYVANASVGSVSQYDVGAGGLLTAKTPATVAAGTGARGVAVSPDGRSVYVTNGGVANNVSQYDVGVGGRLTPKTPATVAAGSAPWWLAVSPDGRSVYVTNYNSASVSQYDVGAGGLLTPKTPATVTAGMGPEGVAVSPDGRSVYVADYSGANVLQYDVGAGGQLAAKTPATVAAGTDPKGVAVSPDGRSLFVTNYGGDNVSQYDADAGGLLAAKTPTAVAAGAQPEGIVLLPDQGPIAAFGATVAPRGSATSFDASGSSDPDGSVARYDWDFGDGKQARNAGPKPTHTYAAARDYTVALTVTDDAGCSTSFVFTGQTASCNGRGAARATRTVSVRAKPARARFGGSKSVIRVNRKGRFEFNFRATPGLTGTAVLKSVRKVRVSRKARVTLARKSFKVPARGKVTLRIRLSKKNFRILKRNRKIRARVTVTIKNAAGLTSTASKRITVRAPSDDVAKRSGGQVTQELAFTGAP